MTGAKFSIMKKTRGFTLVELMIVVALIAIIGGMALPAFRDMVASNRLMTSANGIITTFHQARSDAIRQSRTVSIVACKPDCGNTGTQSWSNGWQIFVAGNATAISEHAPLSSTISSTASGSIPLATSYAYSSQGRLDITTKNAIKLCDSNTGLAGRVITLEPIGHISVSTTACN